MTSVLFVGIGICRCSTSRYVIDSWSILCIKLAHNKEVIYLTCLYVYFIVSSGEFHFGSVVHALHELVDELLQIGPC